MEWEEKSWEDQVSDADAAFEGVVTHVEATTIDGDENGGVPITYVSVGVVEQFSGTELPETFRIIFPGGRFSEEVAYIYPDFPEPEVGDVFVAAVEHIEKDFYGLHNGPSSLTINMEAKAFASDGTPMVSFGCSEPHLLALPVASLPFQRVLAADDESDVGVLRRVWPETDRHVFSHAPKRLALPWAALRGQARACSVAVRPVTPAPVVAPPGSSGEPVPVEESTSSVDGVAPAEGGAP